MGKTEEIKSKPTFTEASKIIKRLHSTTHLSVQTAEKRKKIETNFHRSTIEAYVHRYQMKVSKTGKLE